MMKSRPAPPIIRRAAARRGAALYSVVMFNSLIAGLLGLSALAVVRIERRQSTANLDVLVARKNAESAVATALALIKADTNWRMTYTHNLESSALTFAPLESSSRATSILLLSAAINSGRMPLASGSSRSAPASISLRATASRPSRAA